MAKLSEWLRIMLGEIARKQDEQARADAERQRREAAPSPPPPVRPAAQ
jgi:hypothetical protein